MTDTKADPLRDKYAPPFQRRVQDWMMETFSMEICRDRQERNHRFLEEALELVQASGCTQSEAHQLVDYVYGRDQGEVNQEVGGVMVTLAAHCIAHDIDMHEAGETELARVWTKIDKIRVKQASKPKHSPLPAACPPALPAAAPTEDQINRGATAIREEASKYQEGGTMSYTGVSRACLTAAGIIPPAAPLREACSVSDQDWQRALDCAMNCLGSEFTPAGDISRATMDNAMQHAFGMLSIAAPQPAEPLGGREYITRIIEEKMADAWNDICSDTGCHPLDIEQLDGRHLTFKPAHWSRQTAQTAADAILSALPQERVDRAAVIEALVKGTGRHQAARK